MKMVFSNLGIQCVKKRDIEEALRVREEIRVDPFRSKNRKFLSWRSFKLITFSCLWLAGYAHRSQPSSIDLNAVRLCFQVFLEGPNKGTFAKPLTPVVSETIYDKKSMSDLVITKLSHCNAFCNGGQEMILLCEKVRQLKMSIFLHVFSVNFYYFHRLRKKISQSVSTKRLLMAGKVTVNFSIRKYINRWRLVSAHQGTKRSTLQNQFGSKSNLDGHQTVLPVTH